MFPGCARVNKVRITSGSVAWKPRRQSGTETLCDYSGFTVPNIAKAEDLRNRLRNPGVRDGISPDRVWQRSEKGLPRHCGINFLLCMFNGFAMPKPLCGPIKVELKGGAVRLGKPRAWHGARARRAARSERGDVAGGWGQSTATFFAPLSGRSCWCS